MKNENFYISSEGNNNAKILTESIISLNEEFIDRYGMSGKAMVMGYGDGMLLNYFKNKFSEIILVEASKNLTEQALKKFKKFSNIKISNSYFEEFEIKDKVDVILANHVLEHVDDPIKILCRIKTWLKDRGYVVFTVPNATSLHRRIGVDIGLLEDVYDLSSQDRLVGHKRVYDLKSLVKDCWKLNYTIVEKGGFNIKLVSQNQMQNWSEKLLRSIYKISRECPAEICSNIYVVCENTRS